MKKIGLFFVSVFTVFALSTQSASAVQGVSEYIKATDSFIYLLDNSGSMMMKHEATGIKKIEMAKSIMTKLDSNVPSLGYNAAFALFSPNASAVPATEWNHMAFVDAFQQVGSNENIFGRLTNVGDNVAWISSAIQQLSGSKVAFFISDGMDNLGPNFVESIQALYAADPSMIMHVISLADSAEGYANLKAVAGLNSDSMFVDGRTILDSDVCADMIISASLYTKGNTPSDVVSLQEVLFDVAKATIRPEYASILDEMAEILRTRHDLKILVEGLASAEGDFEYNMALSAERAAAVANYLVNAGVSTDKLIVKASGRTKRFGERSLNRRVDVMIVWD